MGITSQRFCGSILKLQQLTFSIFIMPNICCKCFLADDLYNISNLILPDKKKEEATKPFYSDRLSLTY